MPLFKPPTIEKLKIRRDVPGLLDRLANSSPSSRAQAANALGQLTDPRALHGLLAALTDPGVGVRREAAWALGMLRRAGVVDYHMIFEQLNDAAESDEDEVVRVRVAWAMGVLDLYQDILGGAVLRAGLTDPYSEVRLTTISAIGMLEDAEERRSYLAPLIELLQHDDTETRSASARVLAEIADVAAIAPLIHNLRDARPDGRQSAAEAIGRIKDSRAVMPLLGLLNDADQDVRKAAISALGRQEARTAMTALSGLLYDSAAIRARAAQALGELHAYETADDLFLFAPFDASALASYECALALAKLGDARAVPILVAGLGDERLRSAAYPQAFSIVRNQIIWSLGRMGDERALPALVTTLQGVNDQDAVSAALSLGLLGIQEAVEPLVEALTGARVAIASAAAGALAEIGDIRAIKPLEAAANQSGCEVRISAARALAKLDMSLGVHAMLEILDDPDATLQEQARRSLYDDPHSEFFSAVADAWEKIRD